MRKLIAVAALALLATPIAVAHPHFQKTTTLKIGTTEISISYFTVPANMKHLEKIEEGQFVSPGRPKLTLSADLSTGLEAIPAGTYQVGAIKQAAGWTMVLHPGEVAADAQPDPSRIIRLDSQFHTLGNPIQHLYVDIVPGSGGARGMSVLLIGFGVMRLDGVISESQ